MRYGHYASLSSQPPGAVVACKAVLHDECAVPPYNWRVPYVVAYGLPNAPLKNLVFSPEEIMRRGSELRVNYIYYMTKCINPALDRVLSMCGGEVYQWFRNVSRPKLRLRHINYDLYTPGNGTNVSIRDKDKEKERNKDKAGNKKKQTSMDQYTRQSSCEVCGKDAQPQKTLCEFCSADPQMAMCVVMNRLKAVAEKDRIFSIICHNCAQCSQPSALYAKSEFIGPDCCESLDCQVFYERARIVTRLEDIHISAAEVEQL